MTARERYMQALEDAVAAADQLVEQGHHDRAAGLAVTVDIGAAFLFQVNDRAYENATKIIRAAIAHAQRDTP